MKFFVKENLNDRELQEAIKKMNEQIKNNGGKFTFDFVIDNEGWSAQCREFTGIITGGNNKNPSEKEVMQSLIDVIKTAFHIPIEKLEIEEVISLPKVEIVQSFQFV